MAELEGDIAALFRKEFVALYVSGRKVDPTLVIHLRKLGVDN